jgi:hypothetical protein
MRSENGFTNHTAVTLLCFEETEEPEPVDYSGNRKTFGSWETGLRPSYRPHRRGHARRPRWHRCLPGQLGIGFHHRRRDPCGRRVFGAGVKARLTRRRLATCRPRMSASRPARYWAHCWPESCRGRSGVHLAFRPGSGRGGKIGPSFGRLPQLGGYSVGRFGPLSSGAWLQVSGNPRVQALQNVVEPLLLLGRSLFGQQVAMH